MKEGDVVYFFSDGYADQFGGPKGKKFMYRSLKDLLARNAERSMEEQALILDKTFEQWKGNIEQIDDVVLIGLKF